MAEAYPTGGRDDLAPHQRPERRLASVPPPEVVEAAAAAAEARAEQDREFAMRGLRAQLADRLERLNRDLAQVVWATRRSDPMSPHGLVILRTDGERVYVGARLHLAADSLNPADLADHLAARVRRYLADGIDPWVEMNSKDPLPERHWPLGAGLVTINQPRPWTEIRSDRRIGDGLDIPGRSLAHLVDGTVLHVERPAETARGRVVASCNRGLGGAGATYRRTFKPRGNPGFVASPDTPVDPAAIELEDHDTWHALRRLSHAIQGIADER